MPGEREFQTKLIAWLRGRGCYVVKFHSDHRTGSGTPDLLIAYQPPWSPTAIFIAIECKNPMYADPYWALTKAQRRARCEILKAGGIALCFNNMTQVINYFDALDAAESNLQSE